MSPARVRRQRRRTPSLRTTALRLNRPDATDPWGRPSTRQSQEAPRALDVVEPHDIQAIGGEDATVRIVMNRRAKSSLIDRTSCRGHSTGLVRRPAAHARRLTNVRPHEKMPDRIRINKLTDQLTEYMLRSRHGRRSGIENIGGGR